MLARSRSCVEPRDRKFEDAPSIALDFAMMEACRDHANFRCFGDDDSMNWGPTRRADWGQVGNPEDLAPHLRCPPRCMTWGGWIVQDYSIPSTIVHPPAEGVARRLAGRGGGAG